ncbi:MAG: Na+/H+ antiporter subunit E [Geminicoccaceae bacterium]
MAFIYGVTGTLNMADLAVKVGEVPAGDQAILQLGALLLLVVFGVKAALVPLHFWLPATYASTSPPVAALFAIMTKVGAYAIIRVYISIFGAGAGDAAWVAAPWLLPAALVTLVLGMVGVLAARSLRWMICFSVIGSMGTLFTAIGIFDPVATAAGLYYLLHSTLIAAALFLLVDQIALRRGPTDDRLELAPVPAQGDLLAGLFFIGAIAYCGLPPLSGFIGKLLILEAVQIDPLWPWIWAIILVTSLLAITAFSRAGSLVFWKGRTVSVEDPADPEGGAAVQAGAGLARAAHRGGALSPRHGPADRVRGTRRPLCRRHGGPAPRPGGLHPGRARCGHARPDRGGGGMKLHSRWLRHPLITLVLVGFWLALMNEITLGGVVMGLFLGIVIPLYTSRFWPEAPAIHKLPRVVEYTLIVLWDIVVANVQVAWWILFWKVERLRPNFMTVPLDIYSPEAITMLAGTITMTPGTVSCDLSADGRALLVHGLHAPDVEDTVAGIKDRYERRLREIFG